MACHSASADAVRETRDRGRILIEGTIDKKEAEENTRFPSKQDISKDAATPELGQHPSAKTAKRLRW